MAQTDRSGIKDDIVVTHTRADGTVASDVKGPDPAVWGKDTEREAAAGRLDNKLRKAAK